MISTLSGGEETTRGDRLDLISVLDPSLTVTLGFTYEFFYLSQKSRLI